MYPVASYNLLLLRFLVFLAFGIAQSKRKFCEKSLRESENENPAGCIISEKNQRTRGNTSLTGLQYCRSAHCQFIVGSRIKIKKLL
jgi:hypothetical protein